MDFSSESTYKDTRLSVELASTLLPEAYRSAEFFAAEQEQVFSRGWVAFAAVAELAERGSALVRTIGGRSVVVTRTQQGKLTGFLNVCRHRGSRLVMGDCELPGNKFRCPYHAWTYDLDGNCIGTPMFEGSNIPESMQVAFDMSNVSAFDKADYGLFPVKVETWGPLICVSLDDKVMPLGEWLGDLPDRLAPYDLPEWEAQRTKDYHIAANWKLIAENYMEYYHLPWVHPELIKVSRIQDHRRYQGSGMYTGMTTTPVSREENSVWLDLPPHRAISGEELVSGRFILLMPNAAISVLPNHCFLMILEPLAHDRTLERTVMLAHPSTMEGQDAQVVMDTLMGFWDGVNLEDVAIVENVQIGISTPEYRGGRMCYRFEEPVHRFQNMVIDRMVGLDRVPEGDSIDGLPMFAADD